MCTLQVPAMSPSKSYRSTKVPMLVKCVQGKDIEGNMILNDYVFKQQLGQGSFGDVFVIEKEEHGIFKKFAVKILRRKRPPQKKFGKKRSDAPTQALMDDDVKNQIKAMKSIKHKNIVGIKQVICNQQKEFLYIVMEYCSNGQLIEWLDGEAKFKFRNPRERLTEPEIKRLCRDCLKGLQVIFMNQLVHRDLKPQNILFDEFYNAKVCDFGVVTQINEDTLKDVKGTIMFHSPEIVKKEFPIKGRAADIWALGVSFFCFAFLKHPFVHQPCQFVVDKAMENVVAEDLTFPEDNPYSERFTDFIRQMLIKDPQQRISIADLLNNAWLNEDHECNAHEQVMREMKHQFEIQIQKKPQLSLFQFVMIKQYIREFKKRYAANQLTNKRFLYGEDGQIGDTHPGHPFYLHNPSMVTVQTKSVFRFEIKKPALTLKLYLPNNQFQLKVYIAYSEWGIEFVLSNKNETWSSCTVSLQKVNEVFQRGKKRWAWQQFVSVMKKIARLMKVIDKRLVFQYE